MVTISDSGNTPDDDLKPENKDKFIKTFNLPNSQMHYRPDSILELNKDEVLLDGVEGSTNMKIKVKMLRSMFDTMIQNNPKARFLVDDWNKIINDKTSENYYE